MVKGKTRNHRSNREIEVKHWSKVVNIENKLTNVEQSLGQLKGKTQELETEQTNQQKAINNLTNVVKAYWVKIWWVTTRTFKSYLTK